MALTIMLIIILDLKNPLQYLEAVYKKSWVIWVMSLVNITKSQILNLKLDQAAFSFHAFLVQWNNDNLPNVGIYLTCQVPKDFQI